MISRSASASVDPTEMRMSLLSESCAIDGGRSSGVITVPLHITTALSIEFLSSRTLPGHE